MNVLEIMERTGMKDTNLAIAWIKDAVTEMQSTVELDIDTTDQSIVDGTRAYALPPGLVSIISISVKNTTNDTYERIRRVAGELLLQSDESP
jgi:hypothetical protein